MTASQAKANINIDADIRYAHVDGHTIFDWIPTTNNLITSGSDNEVRLWHADKDEVQDSWELTETPYSIRVGQDRFFVALGDNQIRSYEFEEGKDLGLVCRFTANATAIDCYPDGEWLVAGGADFKLKLVNLLNHEEHSLEGHEGPILSVAIDPLKKHVVSSSCDGTIGLWSIESRSLIYQWRDTHSRSNDFENSVTLARAAWQPKMGEVLALPKAATVELFKRSQWSSFFRKVSHPRLVGEVSIVAFSSDGSLMAAVTGGGEGTLIVWRFSTASLGDYEPLAVLFSAPEVTITDVRFHPKVVGEFATCDSKGTLKLAKIQSLCSATSKANEIVEKKSITQPSQDEAGYSGMDITDYEAMFDDIPDEVLETISLHSTHASGVGNDGEKNQRKKIESVYDEDEDIESRVQMIKKKLNQKKEITPTDKENDDDSEGDIGRIKSQYEPIIFGDDENEEGDRTSKKFSGNGVATRIIDDIEIDGVRINSRDLLAAVRAPRYVPPLQQPAFQPGSTPTHHRQRFMVWNSVGIVYSHDNDESTWERSIDVEFHDNSFHHSIHLDNRLGYTMAALSSTALVLASQEDTSEEADILEKDKSRLYCQMFATWDTTREWHVEINKDEKIMAVAAGQTFVAAVTDLQYVRVWTTGGIQTSILSIAGPPVTLAAHDRYLMILYHGAAQTPSAGQSIWTQVLKIDHKGRTRCHPIATPVQVALSPKASVYWAGFTDEGTPSVVDSDGVVRVWKSHFGYSWLPICATKEHGKGKSDNFFIIGLSEIQAQIRCIYCKASRYPATVPKPTLTILPLAVPLVEAFSAKSKLETQCLMGRWLSSLLRKLSTDGFEVEENLEMAEKQTINAFIKLFALALGADRESLALEIAGLMPNQSALEGAVRYAERQGHRSLATKLIEMIELEETGEASGDDEVNSDTELETLACRVNADSMRRLLKETANEDSNSMISLVKRKTTTTTSISKQQFIQQSILDEDDDDEILLRAVPVNIAKNVSGKNPFKMSNNKNKSKKRRRQEDDDEDSDLEDICSDKNTHDEVVALDEDKDIDLAEEEEEEKKVIKNKKSKKMATKKKKTSNDENGEAQDEGDSNGSNSETKPVNKITNFFKRG